MAKNNLMRGALYKYLPVTIVISLTPTLAIFANMLLTGYWMNDSDVMAMSAASFLIIPLSMSGGVLAAGGSIIFSRYMASGEKEMAANTFNMMVVAATIIGMIFTAICSIVSLYIYLDCGSSLMNYLSEEYILALGLSAIPLMILQVIIMFLRVDRDRKLAIVSFLLFISSDVLAVRLSVDYGFGLFGIGFSIGIASIIGLLLLPIHCRIDDRYMRFKRPRFLKNELGKLYRTGLRSAVGHACSSLRYYFLNVFLIAVGYGSVLCLTAQTTVLNFMIPLFTGIAIMSATLCGAFYSQGDRRAMRDSLTEILRMGLMISTVLMVAVLLLSKFITGIILNDGGDYQSSLNCLRWFALSIPTTTVCMTFIYLYQSTDRKRLSTALTIIRGVLMVMVTTFALQPIIGQAAVWISFLLADASMMAVVVAVSWYENGRFPRSLDDLMMLKDDRYGTPSVFEGSVHSDTGGLETLNERIRWSLSGHSFDSGVVDVVIEKIDAIIRTLTLTGYSDRRKHQIDILIRNEKGLEVTIRDDADIVTKMPEDGSESSIFGINARHFRLEGLASARNERMH